MSFSEQFMGDSSTRKDEVGNREPLAGKGQPSLTQECDDKTVLERAKEIMDTKDFVGREESEQFIQDLLLPTRAELVADIEARLREHSDYASAYEELRSLICTPGFLPTRAELVEVMAEAIAKEDERLSFSGIESEDDWYFRTHANAALDSLIAGGHVKVRV